MWPRAHSLNDMCEITYKRENGEFSITASGHADKDGGPVCAAVSAYFYLIAQGLELWQDDMILDKTVRLEPGDSEVSAKFDSAIADSASIQWDTVALGFLMLQDNYPDKVRVSL